MSDPHVRSQQAPGASPGSGAGGQALSTAGAHYALAEEVTVQQTPTLLREALQALASHAAPWRIDAGGLQRFDSSCLALLMELHRRAGTDGIELSHVPERLRTLARAYGVGFVLDGADAAAVGPIEDRPQR
jgi:phospholipid transport system transporter-binding protein